MNFMGKYQMPQIIQQLFRLERELTQEGYALDRDLSFILLEEYFAYHVTPFDVIPFASTGCDGIHFGFLTDFGKVKNLEEAYIVCISPMNIGNYTKIVAKNIRDFLDLVCTLKSAVAIENFLNIHNKENFERLLVNDENEEEFTIRSQFVATRLKEECECKEIEDIYTYIKSLEILRKKEVIVSTIDGLGVYGKPGTIVVEQRYPLEKDMSINLLELTTFIKSASYELKLALIRDLQFLYLIQEDYELTQLIRKEMLEMNLDDEVDRMEWQIE